MVKTLIVTIYIHFDRNIDQCNNVLTCNGRNVDRDDIHYDRNVDQCNNVLTCNGRNVDHDDNV